MHVRIGIAMAALLAWTTTALAQTGEIQKKVEQKLDLAKKEQSALEDLLTQALKTNPDIRVAEAKLREAEAEVYRARMKVFHRIVALQQELKSSRAQVTASQQAYDRLMDLTKKGIVSQAEVEASAAKLQQAKTDLARAEAEMDLLGGNPQKGHAVTALHAIASAYLAHDTDPSVLAQIGKAIGAKPLDANTATSAPMVQASTGDKIRKALDSTIKVEFRDLGAADVVELLGKHTQGVNVHAKIDRKS